ncbi:SDR family oxidoreductase [Balneola sp. MJW-20]|uniref:SDR family oxidoreductase n=1 Tax=Gracilimonas aurantiaca TaxID=3234185 RepID=UPI003465A66C
MKDKVALITGGAAGIGRATAIRFAEEGTRVVICDIDNSGLKETEELIKKMGAEVLSLKGSISDSTDVQKIIKETINKFGRLDYACNNAGIEGASAYTADYEEQDWDRVLNINLRGQWLCMKYELPEIIKSGGAIVNVSSILGRVGFAGAPAYTAAKHGLIGLTEAAALEYAEQGVRINAVCPGFIDTPMLERAGITTDKDIMDGIIAMHPIGRLGRSKEIAEAVIWLCSEKSSFVTGHSLLVDGGYVIR